MPIPQPLYSLLSCLLIRRTNHLTISLCCYRPVLLNQSIIVPLTRFCWVIPRLVPPCLPKRQTVSSALWRGLTARSHQCRWNPVGGVSHDVLLNRTDWSTLADQSFASQVGPRCSAADFRMTFSSLRRMQRTEHLNEEIRDDSGPTFHRQGSAKSF